ncbi:LysR family transcriptional regulator [Nocardioides sp.]|uniref:LysR family transcriptional regulator n=1 Tax=Nocardioides sp. TaxID=35761 RepID=UPI0035173B0A
MTEIVADAGPAEEGPAGLDPRRVLLFRDVVRAGSISAAARARGWTQPALSQHLAALERSIGTPLLLRGAGGVRPTDAGRLLLARADTIAGELHLAAEELAAVAGGRRGRVRIAAYPSGAATLLPRALAALQATRPDLDVAVVEAEPPEALAALEAGEVDLALVFDYDGDLRPGPPDDRGGRTRVALGEEPVDLVLPPGHPLADVVPLRLADLADAPWIVGCARCRRHTDERCAQAGFVPRVRHVSDDYVVVQRLVALGVGVSLLPRSALEAYRAPEVVVRADPALGSRGYGVVLRTGALAGPAVAALVAELRAAAEH